MPRKGKKPSKKRSKYFKRSEREDIDIDKLTLASDQSINSRSSFTSDSTEDEKRSRDLIEDGLLDGSLDVRELPQIVKDMGGNFYSISV